jgi:HD-GYP domain-containing protein (c-di-GMP phosphodiesterase class II)
MSAVPAEAGAEVALRLRRACEAHDPSIGPHLDRVTRYACALGRGLGLPDDRLEHLRLAAPLHDVGKIGLPAGLLQKPGKLTPAEMETVRAHTTIGHRILDGSPWPVLQCAARIALSHHENWDGSGHPHGLRGEAIPLEARIVAVADVYDALSTSRAYKEAWEPERVVAELRRLRGIKFDPEALDLFLGQLPQLAAV